MIMDSRAIFHPLHPMARAINTGALCVSSVAIVLIWSRDYASYTNARNGHSAYGYWMLKQPDRYSAGFINSHSGSAYSQHKKRMDKHNYKIARVIIDEYGDIVPLEIYDGREKH